MTKIQNPKKAKPSLLLASPPATLCARLPKTGTIGQVAMRAGSFWLLASLLALLITHNSSPVNAQETRTFIVSPPSLKFTIKPGDSIEKSIKITNQSSAVMEFIADLKDFIVTDDKGTPELLPIGTLPDNKYAASTWGTVLPDRITIEPGKTTTTVLYLTVPKDARPGGRYISIAFRPVVTDETEGSGSSVNTIIGTLVYLSIDGLVAEKNHITAFSAPAFSEYGPVKLTTDITNQGDIHSTPKLTVEVKDMLGQKIFSGALPNWNIFPGANRLYTTSIEKKLLFGRFQATLTGHYGTNANLPLLAVASFWVLPYKLILGGLILLLTLLAGGIWFKKNQRQEVKEG